MVQLLTQHFETLRPDFHNRVRRVDTSAPIYFVTAFVVHFFQLHHGELAENRQHHFDAARRSVFDLDVVSASDQDGVQARNSSVVDGDVASRVAANLVFFARVQAEDFGRAPETKAQVVVRDGLQEPRGL